MEMPPSKRRKTAGTPPAAAVPPSPATATWALPVEILLEVAARADAKTLFRCAAACKLLRREILTLDFLRRACRSPGGVLPVRLLSFLDKIFILPEQPAETTRPCAAETHAEGFVLRSSWTWAALQGGR
ncbi:hypothetical protein ACP70R_019728 [Stipagrostis hirtigluma subsp. patula]